MYEKEIEDLQRTIEIELKQVTKLKHEYKDFVAATNRAYDEMRLRQQRFKEAKNQYIFVYRKMKEENEDFRKAWNAYEKLRRKRNEEIKQLKIQHKDESIKAKEYYDKVTKYTNLCNETHTYGTGEGYDVNRLDCLKKAREFRRNAEELFEQVGILLSEIREAKEAAEADTKDALEFREARANMEEARIALRRSEEMFDLMRAQRNDMRSQLDVLQSQHQKNISNLWYLMLRKNL